MKCDISDDHEWKTNIAVRTNQNTKCPYCSGQKVSKTNNLKTLYPAIAAQWHPTKNGELTPFDVTLSSYRRVWWKCPKGHDYDSRISHRTGKSKSGCPYCSGRRVSGENNLLSLFPEISKEWHPTKNGELKPEGVTPGSVKRVWWMCQIGHDYESRIGSRTRKKPTGCPHCYRNSS